MKSVIYTRVSKEEQTTQRQVNDLKKAEGFDIVKVFSENISGFTKSVGERKGLQEMLKYVRSNKIQCILISEISRLGRNTQETLTLIRELEEEGICLHIQNLGITLGADTEKDRIFNKLIITILSDISRLESENLSYRIKSGLRSRKVRGLHVGRKVNSSETRDKFLAKHKQVIKYLNLGRSYKEIQAITGTAPATISKIKKVLSEE
ncbi:recombinase family protein [Pontibacter sp. JH31]|uniref:Recombinase family protein n=1 Tax=Pontibacter aquaedesilientis TaxID=2766980 RepID=A0ABR7XL69_9BACT|nr:recombinase family protein [Pontibacter aquaedesilientis]MBD1399049.1 recombinase family protein [Pontibacter aquaedesilientis]